MNKLWECFSNSTEAVRKRQENLRKITQQLIDDRDCSMCARRIEKDHYEHGRYAGTDPYCPIYERLILEYGYGQQCLFWEAEENI